jgi:type II secretory pathway pseudopilin PulG
MWTQTSSKSARRISGEVAHDRRGEAGYTLVALLALMTVLALFAMAAAPNIRQQARREREIETIFRGEEVADAISRYYAYQQTRTGDGDASLPTSIDQLLEGIPSGTKKVQVLRPSAARELLSDSGEWLLVRPRTSHLSDFQSALMIYAGNVRPVTHATQLQRIEPLMAPPVLPTGGLSSDETSTSVGESSSGPFIGVSIDNKAESVLNYYGISHYNEWVFTPLFR